MRIGQLAETAGVGVETVRFYERKGLIARPVRPLDGGYRDYPTETAERIRFIRTGQRLGFSLAEIEALLELELGPGVDCSQIRARAAGKLDDVSARIAALAEIRAALRRLIAACPGQGPLMQCSILSELRRGGDPAAPITEGDQDGDDQA